MITVDPLLGAGDHLWANAPWNQIMKTKDRTKLWIMHAPVISTGHFTKEEADLLYAGAYMVEQTREPITCILRLSDYEHGQPVLESLSDSTKKLLKHFSDQGFTLLRIDRDGDHLEGFATFDW